MKKIRLDHDAPEAVEQWGWKFHHIGIPTDNVMPGERYMPQFKLYVSGFNTSPYGIEWMRFEKDSPIDKLIQTTTHIAFEVNDLDHELKIHDFKIITKPNSSADGIRVAMIEHNGAPVELIEFRINK